MGCARRRSSPRGRLRALTRGRRAGGRAGRQHEAHTGELLQHRLLLREWAVELPADPQGRRRWAVDEDCDDMLRVCALAVAATPPLKVFGFPASYALVRPRVFRTLPLGFG